MPPLNRRDWCQRTLGLAASIVCCRREANAETHPPTGLHHPALTPFDDLLTRFIADHHVPGAALAVARHGRLIYARGFGLARRQPAEPVQPTSLFRLASVSKPITAIAIMQLVDAGKLHLDDPVLPRMQLPNAPKPLQPRDPRWQHVTIRHCLQHTGGWDKDHGEHAYDPAFRPREVAQHLHIDLPVRPEHVVQYMLDQPLNHDPGKQYAYSNLGYLVLGRVIEAVTGESYEAYVRRAIWKPLGVHRPQLARALPAQRPAHEVHYYDSKNETGPCLYPPHVGETVPLPDGGINVEGFEAHGGWIASAVDLMKLATALDDPESSPLLSAKAIRSMWERPAGSAGHTEDGHPKPAYYGCGWLVRPVEGRGQNTWHNGDISGTESLLVRRWDKLHWAVLFNTRTAQINQRLSSTIDPLLHQAAEKVQHWPDIDLFSKYL